MMRAVFHAPWLIVAAASSIHLYWGALLLAGYANLEQATPVNALINLFHEPYAMGWILVVAATMALSASTVAAPYGIILLFPQQSLLLISAVGVVTAILEGHYADGTIRPWDFISADEIAIPVICLWHATACILTQIQVKGTRYNGAS